jgi:tetratricopeptide (TPR) repeat protein
VLLLLAMIASLVGPWLSDLQIENAARVWTRSRADAYVDLDEAARLNPLSAEPYLLAGSISLRYGDLSRAEHQFEMALQRSPDDSYATLELGAIASAKGQSHLALALLERAAFLNPRGVPTREALELVRSGHRVNITRLDHTILVEGQRLA